MAPRAVIEVRPPEAPRYSMLNTLAGIGLVSETAEGSEEARWVGGAEYLPPSWRASGSQVLDLCGDTPAGISHGGHPDIVREDPFVVYGMDECSTLGLGDHDLRGHARASLLGGQSHQIAAELWLGQLRGAGAGNYFDQATAGDRQALVAVADGTALQALACIDGYVTANLQNRQGFLWTSPTVLVHLAATDALRWQGSYFVTPNGNIVVSDAGFDLMELAQGGQDNLVIVGTGPIEVRLGTIQVFGGQADQAGVNIAINQARAWAERPVLLVTQPESAWGYVTVNDVACAPAGS